MNDIEIKSEFWNNGNKWILRILLVMVFPTLVIELMTFEHNYGVWNIIAFFLWAIVVSLALTNYSIVRKKRKLRNK